MSEINEAMKRIRTEKGMNQIELAEKLHVTRQAVSSWETGRSLISAAKIPAICAALDIMPADLFEMDLSVTDRNLKETPSKENKELLNHLLVNLKEVKSRYEIEKDNKKKMIQMFIVASLMVLSVWIDEIGLILCLINMVYAYETRQSKYVLTANGLIILFCMMTFTHCYYPGSFPNLMDFRDFLVRGIQQITNLLK